MLPLRAWLVQQFQIRKSKDLHFSYTSTKILMTPIDSIPHASSSGNSHNNGQKPISISPTNSTSPVGKESGLANDENTIPKPFGSGEEAVVGTILKSEQPGSVEQSVAGSGLANVENIIPISEQPESVEETVVGSGEETVIKTTETTENETTGQGPAR